MILLFTELLINRREIRIMIKDIRTRKEIFQVEANILFLVGRFHREQHYFASPVHYG